jgi:hypothetical protein
MKAIYGYKPILYYTNGYVTKMIDGIYPDRTVMAFHTIDELELMMQRRNRGDITDLKISDRITNRPYQKMAIKSLLSREKCVFRNIFLNTTSKWTFYDKIKLYLHFCLNFSNSSQENKMNLVYNNGKR